MEYTLKSSAETFKTAAYIIVKNSREVFAKPGNLCNLCTARYVKGNFFIMDLIDDITDNRLMHFTPVCQVSYIKELFFICRRTNTLVCKVQLQSLYSHRFYVL